SGLQFFHARRRPAFAKLRRGKHVRQPDGRVPWEPATTASAIDLRLHGEGIAIPASFDIRASSFLFRYPRFNLVTKYFVDKSRQGGCSVLDRALARWVGFGGRCISCVIHRVHS